MIHCFICLALSMKLEKNNLIYLPMLCGCFVISRVLFAYGYYTRSALRGLGFELAFGSNVISLAYLLWDNWKLVLQEV